MEEEKKISLKDIIKLLLGNKWIYLIMVAAFFVTSIVGFSLYSYLSKEYIAFFNYDVAGFTYDENNGCFIDGEKFDPRSLLTEDKVNSYLKSNDSLNDFTYNEVITKGGVKSFEYKIKYEKNDHVMNDEDNKYIESERGFELILNAKTFSKEQAKDFVEIVANQVIEISKEKIDSIKYDFYLKSFRGANSYSDKVSSLESGIEFINNKALELQNEYGDYAIQSGNYGGEEDKFALNSQKLSEWIEDMNICFKGYFVNSLSKELELGGFIKEDSNDYIASLKTSIENLTRQIAVNESVLLELKNQRDDLVSLINSTSTVVTMEIGEYNSEIISLSKEIAQQKEQLDIYNLQLSKLDTSSMTDEERQKYNASLETFDNKLNLVSDKLDFYSKQYDAIAKTIMKENMAVFYDSADVVVMQGGMKISTIGIISIAIAIFGPMFINLVIAGFREAEGKLCHTESH